MKTIFSVLTLAASSLVLAGCSVFGNAGVEIAPYKVVERDGTIDVRTYPELVLVTTPMEGTIQSSQRTPFFKLFDYISGANIGENNQAEEIAMTAPVIMSGNADSKKSGEKIAMTAPVFMDQTPGARTMSFVLPATYTYETAPRPTDPAVRLQKMTDYTVAAITFSGMMSERNVDAQRTKLENWLAQSRWQASGPHQVAGYNPPLTLPMFRRNEVLIPVEKKK